MNISNNNLPKLGNYIFIVAAVLILGLTTSCEKDQVPAPPVPSISKIEAPENLSTIAVGSGLTLTAISNLEEGNYQWIVNGKDVLNNLPTLALFVEKGGEYNITLKVTNISGSDSVSLKYFAIAGPGEKSSKWISKVIEYRPAPGQHINKAPGNPESAQTIVGKKGIVSLGGYGGYITFKFDHTVMNGQGDDFVIHGNAFKGSSEPGIVMVAYDANGNGMPDSDEWFELKGSAHSHPQTILNYALTYYKPSQTETAEEIKWRDNMGVGFLHAITFHKQCYYPLFYAEGVPETIKFTGTLLPRTAIKNPDTGFWVVGDFEWGYVDNYSAKYPLAIDGDNDTKNSSKFDISNAIDKAGKPVELKAIDFIKVYTGVNQEAGWLGETSTEVCGAISLRANHSN